MAKDFFNETTGKFNSKDPADTQKNANIDASGSVPRLEVNGQSKNLSNKAFGIGREKSNQLIIADPKVSRHHAMVTFEDGEAYIKDTNSANGTFINDKQIDSGKKVKLKNGDKIKMGTTVITFYQ